MAKKDRQPEAEAPAATSKEAEVLHDELKAELDEAIAARQRALADFANFQKRAAEAEVRAAAGGAARVARSLLGVLDHFDLALDQPVDTLTVEQLLGGVRIVRDELLKALSTHGVERLDPAVGEPFDPHCHEAVMRQPSEDVEPDHIASVMQPGYVMGQIILRPAKVVIAAPPEAEAAGEEES
jgi:molecular chaperone GrpE